MSEPDETIRPKNKGMFRGLKRWAVEAFIRHIKQNCLGEVGADMHVRFTMTFDDLDKMGREFLEEVR